MLSSEWRKFRLLWSGFLDLGRLYASQRMVRDSALDLA